MYYSSPLYSAGRNNLYTRQLPPVSFPYCLRLSRSSVLSRSSFQDFQDGRVFDVIIETHGCFLELFNCSCSDISFSPDSSRFSVSLSLSTPRPPLSSQFPFPDESYKGYTLFFRFLPPDSFVLSSLRQNYSPFSLFSV